MSHTVHKLRRSLVVTLCLGLLVVALGALSASADTLSTDFETFSLGSVHNQDGWSHTAIKYDVEVDDQADFGLNYAGFGSRSLRISNAVVSGSYGDQTFSKSLTDEAGEASAANGGMSGGTRQPFFEAAWDFASTKPNEEQENLSVVASADRGDGARMTWLQMRDTPTGLEVVFQDYDPSRGGTCGDGLNFLPTVVATGLARNAVHNVRMTIQFVDGVNNDVAKIYVNGTLVHTGKTWEEYFRDCELNPTRTVDSIIFRTGGTTGVHDAPSLDGFGFLIDNFEATSGPVPQCTTTCYADAVNGNDLNGGTSPTDAKKTIQAAVNQVDEGGTVIAAAGTYPETVIVNKKITLDGAGSGDDPQVDTIIDPLTASGIRITASGTSATDRLVIKDLRVTGAVDDGIRLEGTGGSYLTLDNVASIGNPGASTDGLELRSTTFVVTDLKIINSNLSDNGNAGFRMGTNTKLDGLTVENSTLSGNKHGVSVFTSTAAPIFDNIAFTNVTISNNTDKGIYVERLNNGTFSGLTVTGNGSAAAAFMAGIDINLKYANFSNITIEDSTFENNGLGDTDDVGIDLTIKARNDGSYASQPASLTNLDVNHNTFGGAAHIAMSVGNNLDEATTAINRNAFGGTNTAGLIVFETPPESIINATCNWWGDASGPSGEGSGNGNTVSTDVDFTPWLFSANLDSDCYVPGTITVVKETNPDGDTTPFTFDPSWGANFMLSDGQSLTSPALNPDDGPFSVAEINLPANWAQTDASCTNGIDTADPSNIELDQGETWICTFENDYTQPVGRLYISPNKKKGTIGGVPFTSGDILVNIIGTDNWAMHFDGSDVGLKVNLTDYVFLDDGCMLMTFNGNFKIKGFWTFKPQDIAKFCPTSTGEVTEGTWEVYFDGSDVGLKAGPERIDGLAMTPDGDLIISTKGNFNLKPADPMKGKKNELLRFTPTSLGENTAGTWTLFYSNATVIPKKANPLSLDLIDGNIYMSIWGKKFVVGGVPVDDNDVFYIDPNTNDVTIFWDGDLWGYNFRIMGLHIAYD